jgi:transcriptional regulator with XRE-family HTH domain
MHNNQLFVCHRIIACNITQEDFYNDTGINIGRIERAVNDLSVSTLSRICEYFDITIQEFFSKP